MGHSQKVANVVNNQMKIASKTFDMSDASRSGCLMAVRLAQYN